MLPVRLMPIRVSRSLDALVFLQRILFLVKGEAIFASPFFIEHPGTARVFFFEKTYLRYFYISVSILDAILTIQ